MRPNIAIKNAELIISNPHGNYTTFGDKLILISKYNIFSRFVKWFQNLLGGVDQKINKVAEETLQEMNALSANPHNLYLDGQLCFASENPCAAKKGQLLLKMQESTLFEKAVVEYAKQYSYPPHQVTFMFPSTPSQGPDIRRFIEINS